MSDENISDQKGQIIYFSHGGGPLPILGDRSHQAMVSFMRELPANLRRPQSILVISAHWEESLATLIAAEKPDLFYDYYGFPEQAYHITYPIPGNPSLAENVADLLRSQGVSARLELERGFDHGLFIPLKLMYPAADIPATQLSLVRGLDPETHIRLGNALKEIMRQNVLIIGSGFSFHNMAAFSWQDEEKPDPENEAFQNWLVTQCVSPMAQEDREQALIHWESAPFARYCHPRSEHLMPLLVCAGVADKPAQVVFDARILGKRSLAFLWQ